MEGAPATPGRSESTRYVDAPEVRLGTLKTCVC